MHAVSEGRDRIYQRVVASIAEQIHNGDLTDGSLLPSERELAKTYGVSRTAIREALLSLQSSGLISMREKARARVSKLNNSAFFNQLSGAAQVLLAQPNGMADFQEARVLFECGLVRHVAKHASPKEVDRLGQALAKNEKAIGNADMFAKTDVEFHNVLAEIPHNPIFTALNNALSAWLFDQRDVSVRAPIKDIQQIAYDGHRRVFEAISAHDPEAADKAMAEHLKTVAAAYWTGIDSPN